MPKIVRIHSGSYSITPEKVAHTTYIQGQDGHMMGRRVVTPARSDKTSVIRLTKDIDVNKDGKIGKGDLFSGNITGRHPSGVAKPSFILVNRHYRNGTKPVSRHYRRA